MIKKISAFLLVAIMLVAVFTPLTAMAATSGKCGDNLTWTLDDYGTLTISGTGKMTDWNSSSSVPWIDYRSQIRKVIINYGVTSIGNRAFSGCYGLTSVIIPNSVTSIGDNVLESTGLTSVIIPESVTSIGGGAFMYCLNLTPVIIPNSVTSIGFIAFQYCKSLTTISIPESVTSIGGWAFRSCSNLKEVTIKGRNTTISDSFEECPSDLIIYGYAGSTVETYANANGFAFKALNKTYTIKYNANGGSGAPSSQTKEEDETINLSNLTPTRSGYAFIGWSETPNGTVSYQPGAAYTKNSSVTLYAVWKDGNKIISTWPCGDNLTATLKSSGELTISGSGAMTDWWDTNAPWYDNRSSVKTIIVDYGVTNIGANAFTSCVNLTSVTLPGTVTIITKNAFSSCISLATINIPSKVEIIGQDAFRSCIALKSVTIPGTVTIIGDWTFGGCDSLADVYYGGTEANWNILSGVARIPSGAKIHYNYASPGTIIGSALRTNVTAAINGHAIPSFNVDGYTYIVAEDLKDYGFSVYYDNNTRTLALSRDTSKKYVSRSYVKPYVPENEVGIKEHDLVATDIVTYIDNNYAQSYNINGQTIIRFDVLGRYGAVSYDNSTRIISVNIPGLN